MPLIAKCAVANARLLNQDFEYICWNDESMEEFVNKHCPEYRAVFHSFPLPIQRYDFFRYLAIYQLGGFYLDMDVFLASNLSDLLECECVFPFEALTINRFLREEYAMDWEVGNYAFGATAGHPFIRAIIDNCVRAQRNPDWAGAMARSIPRPFRGEYHVVSTTGPWLVSRTLAEFPNADSKVTVLFPKDVCDQQYWNRFGEFGVHLMASSWRSKNGMVHRRLIRVWHSLLMRKMYRSSMRFGKHRSLQFMKERMKPVCE